MKADDFDMYDDPRVREVMAAAANLVEYYSNRLALGAISREFLHDLKEALFAAQHSKPKTA